MAKKKREHRPKYQKRQKDGERKYFTVRSLVTEITGAEADSDEFERSYREVNRIVEDIQKTINRKGRLKIPPEVVKGFVDSTKHFYFDGQERELYLKKIRGNESLTTDELERLIAIFRKSLDANPESEEKKLLLEQLNVEYEFGDRIDHIRKQMLADIDLVDTIQNHQQKIAYMRKYEELLQKLLTEWRKEVRAIIREESILQKLEESLIAEGIDLALSPEEIPEPLVRQTIAEMVKEDAEKIAKRIKEKGGLQS
ncbi:hypothetical protein ACFSO0_11570 [Brevibacillus sp. GCM10020057]|uniref:hypothetical protein n=1 Tax=Brevibacillus sp. GCM10020057 TaxID=3317327 RepID=UPI003625FF97